MLKAISIILKGRQGTIESFNCYSRRSLFSLIVVLLNFRKYRRSVSFPKIVVSAFTGLVLYLCHDFSCLISNLFLVNSKLLRSYSRLMVAPDELGPMWLTHRVISDRIHRLLVTLSYFRPDRFVQLLSLIPILILRLYFLVSGCLTSLC